MWKKGPHARAQIPLHLRLQFPLGPRDRPKILSAFGRRVDEQTTVGNLAEAFQLDVQTSAIDLACLLVTNVSGQPCLDLSWLPVLRKYSEQIQASALGLIPQT